MQQHEQYGMCVVAVAALRLQPDHRSEMISQLLFGEFVTVSDRSVKGWCRVVAKYDGYSGWCLAAHIDPVEAQYYDQSITRLTAGWINTVTCKNQSLTVPLGCSLPGVADVQYNGKVVDTTTVNRNETTITETAMQYLHTPYLWGGRSVFGIDCSGFTQAVYQFFNYPLLRDAHLQATQGELVNFIQEARCGDLAFFDNEEGHIIHVGLLLGANKIIHSAGKVRIDRIDHQGVIHADTGERTQHLRIIKRYF